MGWGTASQGRPRTQRRLDMARNKKQEHINATMAAWSRGAREGPSFCAELGRNDRRVKRQW